MIRQFALLILFFIQFDQILAQDVSQNSQNKPEFTFTPDKSLKSITKYNISKSDSVISAQWIYSKGKLMKIIKGDNDITDFFYENKYNVNSINGEILNKYIFDQLGNLFYQRTIANKKEDNKDNPCPTFEIRNYVYVDSLKTYCNGVMSQTKYSEEWAEKYEYDNNRNLIKVFYRYMTYEPDYYKLQKELIYNSEGLLIKTLGNPLDQLAGGQDSTLYAYNNKNQLIEEISNSLIEKSAIQYFYNNKGLLKKVVEVSDLDTDTYTSHYHFEY